MVLEAGFVADVAAVLVEDVVLSTDRDTTDIDRSEVQAMITMVGQYADHFDDELVAEFGGLRHSDAGKD